MTKAHRIDPGILRAYDIRGIVGETLTEADAHAVGRAFGTQISRAGGKTACVGYDGRLSSPGLAAAVVDGLVACGLAVERIGLGPTPMLYFAVKDRQADGGVMVTGSHNPPEYNGIKMVTAGGAVYGEQVQEIGRLAAAGDYAEGTGSVSDTAVADAYVDRLARDYDGKRDLTVAWDAGNGAVGAILGDLTARLPGQHHLLFDDVDGTFPNHHPDPTLPETLTTLQQTVADAGCDIGLAFDGDGDRVGVVDETGEILWADQMLALMAADVLASHPGATIIGDVKSSKTLFDEVARLGGKPLMWKTGHSLIKAKMAEIGAPLAGEMSGHIFFADRYYGFDDGPYVAIRLLGLLGRLDQPLSALRQRLPATMNTPETRFPVDEVRKFAVIDEIAARLATEGADVFALDGVRVSTADGWWLLRASNTQDVLVARAESETADGLERLKQQIVHHLSASGVDAPTFP